MADRQGVEIDHRPQCRGVWLDRGELDKIIERSAQGGRPVREASDDYRSGEYRRHYPRKKKSFLGEMFDFD
jgi:Zn-finger nucleic acid-binding protein